MRQLLLCVVAFASLGVGPANPPDPVLIGNPVPDISGRRTVAAVEDPPTPFYGLTFDGTDDYVEVPAFDGTGGNGQYHSVFCWSKTTRTSRGYIAKQGGWSWQIRWYDARLLILLAESNNKDNYKEYIYTGFDDQEWHHIGFTWAAGTLIGYVDGIARTPTLARDDAFTTTSTYRTEILIGDDLPGDIVDMVMYDRAVSAGEISEIMAGSPPADGMSARWCWQDAGSGQILTDLSGNAHDGQLGSTAGSDTNDPTWSSAYTTLSAGGPQ